MTDLDTAILLFLMVTLWCGAAWLLLRLVYALDRLSDRRRARRIVHRHAR